MKAAILERYDKNGTPWTYGTSPPPSPGRTRFWCASTPQR